MLAAKVPRNTLKEQRLLVVDRLKQEIVVTPFSHFPNYFSAQDVLVLNDAATLPASLWAGNYEVRLAGKIENENWRAVIFKGGSWKIPTELREIPSDLKLGQVLSFSQNFSAQIKEISNKTPHLVEIKFNKSGADLLEEIYSLGSPIQYSYLKDTLKLWSVQNSYSSKPWAVEMPSAGRALTGEVLIELIKKNVSICTLTHAAGLSSLGNADADKALPLPERFKIPQKTLEIIQNAKNTKKRVIAIGTSTVRALESQFAAKSGETDLVINAEHAPHIATGILTGIHEVHESHFQLLSSFCSKELLQSALVKAQEEQLFLHEFGDSMLLL